MADEVTTTRTTTEQNMPEPTGQRVVMAVLGAIVVILAILIIFSLAGLVRSRLFPPRITVVPGEVTINSTPSANIAGSNIAATPGAVISNSQNMTSGSRTQPNQTSARVAAVTSVTSMPATGPKEEIVLATMVLLGIGLFVVSRKIA